MSNPGFAADQKTIHIGVPGVQGRTFIAVIRGVNVTRGLTVVVDRDGKLGTVRSSRRVKQDIEPMGDASDPLMQLRPVIFRYKQSEEDGSKP